jgi:hypothetical protein
MFIKRVLNWVVGCKGNGSNLNKSKIIYNKIWVVLLRADIED